MLSVAPISNLYGTPGNSNTPAPWQTAPSAAAFGTKPAPVQPQITAPQATGTAIGLGQQVYSQLPNYSQDINQIGSNVNSELQGQLPADVQSELTNEAAARGVANGTGGAEVNQDILKTLGLTSLQLTQMGQQGLDTQLGMLPGAALYQNPGFYPTTGQTYEAGVQNSLNAAAPDPFAAANAAIGAAGAGYAAGNGGGGGLPPTPASGGGLPSTAGGSPGGTLSAGASLIPGVPYNTAQPGTQDVLSQILNNYNPESPASSETAQTQFEADQEQSALADVFGNQNDVGTFGNVMDSLYPSS